MRGQLKYKNHPTVYNGVRYASRKEADYAWGLDMAVKSLELIRYERQVPFKLPGGIKYVLDFKEYWRGGEVRYVDVKGFRTPVYKIKKKQVEEIYKIKIIEA